MPLRPLLLAFLLLAVAAALSTPARAQGYECDKPAGWKLAEGQLKEMIARRQEGISFTRGGWEPNIEERAILCNVNLEDADLGNVDLDFADLNGANLRKAKLSGAKLFRAELNGADLRGAELNGANLAEAELNCLNPGAPKPRCADLFEAELNGANLSGAKLNGANLSNAKLNCLNPGTPKKRCANLNGAELNGADLSGAKLNGASLSWAELNGANLYRAELNQADLRGAELNCLDPGTPAKRCANLNDAELNRADLTAAELNGAYLNIAKLSGAKLFRTELNGAHLWRAELNGAFLEGAKLNCLNPGAPEPRCADLRWADLTGAYMRGTELNGANLTLVKLKGAKLLGAELNGAKLRRADMTGVIFEPDPEFSHRDFRRVVGLHLMRFEENPDALVRLRQGFREAGRRDLERQITYAIKRSERLNAQKRGGLGTIEAGFNFVLFEFTTEWGLSPGRALIILALLVLGSAVFYLQAVYVPTTGDGGIYRLWENEEDRRAYINEGRSNSTDTKHWVNEPGARAPFWALYFSLISAFNIGFRELNIGNWIQRINPHDYSVRATGWVKTLSGVQSVLSVYLLAIWALTYFGRPFG